MAMTTALPLTDAEIATFERDGILSFDPAIAVETLDAAVAETAPLLGRENGSSGAGAYTADRVMDAWRTCPSVRALARAPRVLAALEQLYGRTPRPFQTLNFPRGTEQATHSDTIHFNSDPKGLMCGVWIALEDIDESNGPLQYYPGSHTFPELTMEDAEARGLYVRPLRDRIITAMLGAGVPLSKRHWFRYDEVCRDYEKMIADEVRTRRLVPSYATMPKGRAVIWAANLLHGGAPQRDKSRTRHSQVTHYFFEGVRAYSPLRSHGDYVYWRDPIYIE